MDFCSSNTSEQFLSSQGLLHVDLPNEELEESPVQLSPSSRCEHRSGFHSAHIFEAVNTVHFVTIEATVALIASANTCVGAQEEIGQLWAIGRVAMSMDCGCLLGCERVQKPGVVDGIRLVAVRQVRLRDDDKEARRSEHCCHSE